MKFRTEIDIPQAKHQIDYSSMILSLGSCFASSIGNRLIESKFHACVNPFGVLFNPLSICSTLQRLSSKKLVKSAELECSAEGWFHFDFHGSLSDTSSQGAIERMNCAVEVGHQALLDADVIIITLGTIWVYELADSGKVVANCHKQPVGRFVRRAMSVDEVVEVIGAQLTAFPAKQFIFSVSPVRHLADGLAENSLSKATLRVAIDRITKLYDNASYFAAYEILIDDLRDYRFYADDMLHPSTQAVEYIWSKFCKSNISLQALVRMESVTSILKAVAHRPHSEGSVAYLEFCRKQLELIEKHPTIDFTKESDYFRSKLQKKL